MEYPLLVEEYGLIEDSGGAGTWRGGMGLRRVVRPIGHDCLFTGIGERFRNRPWGVFGARPGAAGRFLMQDDDGTETKLGTKPGDLVLRADQQAVVETPGAGGYGRPEHRSAENLAEDWESGKFTAAYMKQWYGWEPPV
jgi:N-methylhydantoinase B